jgi:hypothetical protein
MLTRQYNNNQFNITIFGGDWNSEQAELELSLYYKEPYFPLIDSCSSDLQFNKVTLRGTCKHLQGVKNDL